MEISKKGRGKYGKAERRFSYDDAPEENGKSFRGARKADRGERETESRRPIGYRTERGVAAPGHGGFSRRDSFKGEEERGNAGRFSKRAQGSRPGTGYAEEYGRKDASPRRARAQGNRPGTGYAEEHGRKDASPRRARQSFRNGDAVVQGRPPREFPEKFAPRKTFPVHKPASAGRDVKLSSEVRLNKFIANSGVCSRREADSLIQAGVVTVNGEVVTELGVKINPLKDTVVFGGQKLKGEDKIYIVMNKPRGFVTTTSDPHAEQTVMDLLTACPSRVFPVGRLDKNTTGVLLFTNDGEMSERLTHPSYLKRKIYEVTLDRKLSEEDASRILSGVGLEDGEARADELAFSDPADRRKVGIEIHSGKNRIVRRMFEALGYSVKALDRVYFAGISKKGVKRGQWRYLSESEINILKIGAFN